MKGDVGSIQLWILFLSRMLDDALKNFEGNDEMVSLDEGKSGT